MVTAKAAFNPTSMPTQMSNAKLPCIAMPTKTYLIRNGKVP